MADLVREKRYYLMVITDDGLVKPATNQWGNHLTSCGKHTEEECWQALELDCKSRGCWDVSAIAVCEWTVRKDYG